MPRVLRRHFGYVLFTTMSLALPIGATLAVFTVVNTLWLRPLPFADPDRLVFLADEGAGGFTDSGFFSGLETSSSWTAFADVAGQVVTTGHLGPASPHLTFNEIGRELETLGVTSQYFSVLGVPIRGRDFTSLDNRYGAEPVAIISDRLWARAFGRRAEVIGSVVAARPMPLRIVGVAPAGIEGARRGERFDVWVPSNLVPRLAPVGGVEEDGIPTLVLARLRPGVSVAETKERLVRDAIGEGDRRSREQVRIVPLASVFGTPTARTVVIAGGRAGAVVGALAGLVLLAACTTLMALALVHYERRRRELCVRLALGASPGRLARDLVRELVLPGAAGAIGAVGIAVGGLRILPSLSLPGGVEFSRLDLSIDWRVLAASVAATTLTLAAAAVVPVSRFTRGRLASELVGSTSTTPASSHRLRQMLLGVHVSATIIVLIAAGLFVRAVVHGFSAGAGFDVDHTLFVKTQLAPPFVGPNEDAETRAALARAGNVRIEDGLRALPGVQLVARGRSPIGPDSSGQIWTRTIETRGGRRDIRIGVLSEGADLLTALGVPVVRGRALTPADAGRRPAVVVVTESLVRTLWPGEDAIGQELVQIVSGRDGTSRRAVSIVSGVAADFAYASMGESLGGVLILVSALPGGGSYVVRTEPDAATVAPQVERLLRDLVPDAPRTWVTTGRAIVSDDLGRQRLGAWFFSGFGLVALGLGLGGVFGLVAYLAQSRRREFGVRLALGATPRHLLRRGMAAGLTPVALGAGAGLAGSVVVAHGFISLLPGLGALDALTYVSVSVLMVGCAAAASLAGAWPLLRLRPGDALRAE